MLSNCFKLWCWSRLLRVPWTERRWNQSILKEINPDYSLGRTDAEGQGTILWPPDVKSLLTGKDPDAGKDWVQEKRAVENEMVRWHHRHNGHEFEQTLGDSVACCSAGSQREELRPWQRSWGRRFGIRKGLIKAQETPCSWALTPKTRVHLLHCFMLLPTPLTLWGAAPHRFSRRRSKRAAPSQ